MTRRTWCLQLHQGTTTVLLQHATLKARAYRKIANLACDLEAHAWPWKIGPNGRTFGDLLFEINARMTAAEDRHTTTLEQIPVTADMAARIAPELADLIGDHTEEPNP